MGKDECYSDDEVVSTLRCVQTDLAKLISILNDVEQVSYMIGCGINELRDYDLGSMDPIEFCDASHLLNVDVDKIRSRLLELIRNAVEAEKTHTRKQISMNEILFRARIKE